MRERRGEGDRQTDRDKDRDRDRDRETDRLTDRQRDIQLTDRDSMGVGGVGVKRTHIATHF